MAKVLLLPEIAESVVEGEILRWLKKEGEFVKKNEPIVEVMTEKVTVEIPSPYEGVLAKILAPEGSVILVHKPIAVFAEPGEDPASLDLSQILGEEAGTVPSGAGKTEQAAEEPSTTPVPTPMATAVPEAPPVPGPIKATPAARKAARELGIDLREVPPSTPVGRIVKADVLRYAEQIRQRPPIARVGAIPEPERIPFRGLRREIARRLRQSKDQAVHTLHVDEADLTELVRIREKLKPLAEQEGVKLTFLPFIIKAVIQALRKYPMLNATVDDERGEIVLHKTYNIGVAVATDQGLVVPVIHHAEQKDLFTLAREITEKAEKARQGALTLEDVEGGTFSITNIGSIGGLFSFPVINYPQVAILGVHSIKKRPVVGDHGDIVIRDMVYLSVAFDHRVTDGAEVAWFTRDLIAILENPERLLLSA